MKKIHLLACTVFLMSAAAGWSGDSQYHPAALPDPASFNAHFGDMDGDGDDRVDLQELTSYFPQATPEVFKALDLNGDGGVDHDEWHAFKEAHGLRDHD